jgi:hypothetical protein
LRQFGEVHGVLAANQGEHGMRVRCPGRTSRCDGDDSATRGSLASIHR